MWGAGLALVRPCTPSPTPQEKQKRPSGFCPCTQQPASALSLSPSSTTLFSPRFCPTPRGEGFFLWGTRCPTSCWPSGNKAQSTTGHLAACPTRLGGHHSLEPKPPGAQQTPQACAPTVAQLPAVTQLCIILTVFLKSNKSHVKVFPTPVAPICLQGQSSSG